MQTARRTSHEGANLASVRVTDAPRGPLGYDCSGLTPQTNLAPEGSQMRLTLLGTGNALVTECYNTCFVMSHEEDGEVRHLLVDGGGGNGILRQLKRAGIDPNDVHEVFVTHKHLDHLMGVVWMVRVICQRMAQGTYRGEAWFYGHDEVIRLLGTMAEQLLTVKQTAFIGARVHLVTVRDGERRELIGHEVTFFDIRSTKARQFGFSMVLDSEGHRLTCCGDEPYADHERPYAEGATWLLHEAFCLRSQADVFHPYEKCHSTVADACELAEGLGVRNLVLYHTEDRNIAHRRELYLAEGAPLYHGNLYVPDDLDIIEL